MLSVDPVRHESRPWRQSQRGGTREDRLLREVIVTIPPALAGMAPALPSATAARLDDAARAITRLDATAGPTLAALGSLLLRAESLASSKIEQISAPLSDYARALHGSGSTAAAASMAAAARAMDALVGSVGEPITVGGILRAHRILLTDDPSEQGHAGRIRDVQNWVGGSDYSPRNALLVPPPPELIEDLMQDLVSFAGRTDLPALMQATIVHAQFETIHPFIDGNGRIGRALINALLRARGTTTCVVIPLASALVARRESYFASLDAYRDGDLEPLMTDVIGAARLAAEESSATADRLGALPAEWRQELGEPREGTVVADALRLILANPVVTADDVQRHLDCSTSIAYTAVMRLADVGILRPLTQRRRDQIWGAAAVLDELADLDLRIGRRARLELGPAVPARRLRP